MTKTNPPSASPAYNYQKFFDPKSLKSVASCAGVIFIITHLIDYLGNFSIDLRILNFVTLFISLIVTFLFVVNEIGRVEEKVILGVANAALLFFSVIGFNSTWTSSNILSNTRPAHLNARQKGALGQVRLEPVVLKSDKSASLFDFFGVRNWMPPAALLAEVDTLLNENRELRNRNTKISDSLKSLIVSSKANINATLKQYPDEEYLGYKKQLHDMIDERSKLLADLEACREKADRLLQKTPPRARIANDTSITGMDKGQYFEAYKSIKAQFEAELKKCQTESNEYKGKYNQLLIAYKKLSDQIGGGTP
jgi:hypothetical protein